MESKVRPTTILWGIVVMSILSFIGISLITAVANDNSYIVQDDSASKFNESFNRMQDIIDEKDDIQGRLNGTGIENIPAVGPAASLILNTWAYIKGMIGSGFLTISMFNNSIFAAMGIEGLGWLATIIQATMVLFMGFYILSVIFKWEL